MKNDKIDPALKLPTPAEQGGSTGPSLLKKLFGNCLKDISWAESQLMKYLPVLRDQATSPALKMAIQDHIMQTEIHVKRLDEVFVFLGDKPQSMESEAMKGLMNECDSIINSTNPETMSRDAAIIMAAQKVEHYEIATYGSLLEFARTLGFKQIAGLLNATLDEEKQTDQALTLIAQTGINWDAEYEEAEQTTDHI